MEIGMRKSLDYINHIAIQIQDIEQSVSWYTSLFDCEVSYCDDLITRPYMMYAITH